MRGACIGGFQKWLNEPWARLHRGAVAAEQKLRGPGGATTSPIGVIGTPSACGLGAEGRDIRGRDRAQDLVVVAAGHERVQQRGSPRDRGGGRRRERHGVEVELGRRRRRPAASWRGRRRGRPRRPWRRGRGPAAPARAPGAAAGAGSGRGDGRAPRRRARPPRRRRGSSRSARPSAASPIVPRHADGDRPAGRPCAPACGRPARRRAP